MKNLNVFPFNEIISIHYPILSVFRSFQQFINCENTPYFVPGLSMILDKCKVASRQTISEKSFREKKILLHFALGNPCG